MRFENKIIIISGGSTGIGAATAKLFASEGATVYVLDIQPLSYQDHHISFIPCDVSCYEEVQKAVDQVISKTNRIDYLFANAGIYLYANLEETSPDEFEHVLGVNLKGTFYALKCVIPQMKQQRQGAIVLMGSDQTFVAKKESAVYGATKAAIGQLTKSTAVDYASHNIRINCVCPGTVATPLYYNFVDRFASRQDITEEEALHILNEERPMLREGAPEEIANVVAFLCSDQASFMTGSLVSVDGGFVAQ